MLLQQRVGKEARVIVAVPLLVSGVALFFNINWGENSTIVLGSSVGRVYILSSPWQHFSKPTNANL